MKKQEIKKGENQKAQTGLNILELYYLNIVWLWLWTKKRKIKWVIIIYMYMNVNLIVCTYDHSGSCMCNSLPSTKTSPERRIKSTLSLVIYCDAMRVLAALNSFNAC